MSLLRNMEKGLLTFYLLVYLSQMVTFSANTTLHYITLHYLPVNRLYEPALCRQLFIAYMYFNPSWLYFFYLGQFYMQDAIVE